MPADASHAVGNGDGGQAATTVEGIVADAGHALGDDDGGQAAAPREGLSADAGHGISFVGVSNRCRDNNTTRVRIVV